MIPKPKLVGEQIQTYRQNDAMRGAELGDRYIDAQEKRERGCRHVADDCGEFCVKCEAWMGVGL